jgi:DNA-binding NtrC family response regulator
MVYGIVQKHGGHIAVDSELGLGTTFKIYLPRADEPMEKAQEEPLGNELPRGRETVLVVEDEKDLRISMAQALRQQGYKALDAANGEEGLLLFDKYREEINLIVADVVMPVMDGFELTDLIMPLCPQMKALYVSGYSDNPAFQKRNLDPKKNFLPKPFSLKDLALKVRKVLDT